MKFLRRFGGRQPVELHGVGEGEELGILLDLDEVRVRAKKLLRHGLHDLLLIVGDSPDICTQKK